MRPSSASRAVGSGSGASTPGAMGSPPASSTVTRCILSRRGRGAVDQRGISTAHSCGGRGPDAQTCVQAAVRIGRRVAGADPVRRRHSGVPPLRRVHHPAFGPDLEEEPLEPGRLAHRGTTIASGRPASSSTDSAGEASATQPRPRGSSRVTRGSSGRGWNTRPRRRRGGSARTSRRSACTRADRGRRGTCAGPSRCAVRVRCTTPPSRRTAGPGSMRRVVSSSRPADQYSISMRRRAAAASRTASR